MEADKILLCGGTSYPSHAVMCSLDSFVRDFGGCDRAWAALHACTYFDKPVRFIFDDGLTYYVMPGDPLRVGTPRQALHFESIEVATLMPIRPELPTNNTRLLPAPEPRQDLLTPPHYTRRRVCFELRPVLHATVLVDADTDEEAEILVRGNFELFVPDLMEIADNCWKGFAMHPDPELFNFTGIERAD